MQTRGACYVGPHITYSGSIQLYTNRWGANVLAGDCVQVVHKNVKYRGGGCLKCRNTIVMRLKKTTESQGLATSCDSLKSKHFIIRKMNKYTIRRYNYNYYYY